MKKVLKKLKNHRYICFLDFEGTQFSHEMIAYGALLATIDKQGRIIKKKAPIKRYVKAKNPIGRYVENLTGITRLDLDRFGLSFANAMKDLKRYCGMAFRSCSFMTFGNHDFRILNQSISYNLDSPKPIYEVIRNNYVDFQAIITEFIKDEKNNVLSLTHNLEVFNLKFEGDAHDPQNDAINLARLYDAFMREDETILKEFKKTLSRSSFNPSPIDKTVKKLLSGETVTPEDLESYIKEYIE